MTLELKELMVAWFLSKILPLFCEDRLAERFGLKSFKLDKTRLNWTKLD